MGGWTYAHPGNFEHRHEYVRVSYAEVLLYKIICDGILTRTRSDTTQQLILCILAFLHYFSYYCLCTCSLPAISTFYPLLLGSPSSMTI